MRVLMIVGVGVAVRLAGGEDFTILLQSDLLFARLNVISAHSKGLQPRSFSGLLILRLFRYRLLLEVVKLWEFFREATKCCKGSKIYASAADSCCS